jgi:hypothetical protein
MAQLLHGVFVPTEVGLDLEPLALGGGHPAQSKVRTAMQKLRIVTLRVWHGVTETGP